ncbi:MAG: hypothetical protein LBS77_00515 [Desulfovibrio sp.]|nr:hypothetical protein [Desulfovibrio sp.]
MLLTLHPAPRVQGHFLPSLSLIYSCQAGFPAHRHLYQSSTAICLPTGNIAAHKRQTAFYRHRVECSPQRASRSLSPSTHGSGPNGKIFDIICTTGGTGLGTSSPDHCQDNRMPLHDDARDCGS